MSVKLNGSTGFAIHGNIKGNNFITLKNHLHSPDEMKFCSDRQRPANTFPPVFTGLQIFGVGFYPIYESMNLAHTGVDCGRH